MKIKILEHGDFLEDLKNTNTPFTLESTTFTKTITISQEEVYYYTANGKLKLNELNLIKGIKKHCQDLKLRIKVNRDVISYIKVNNFKNGIYKKDIYELDLNAAYWKLAHKYGYISDELYNKGLNLNEDGTPIKPRYNRRGEVMNHVSKKARLIALGNLAKTSTVFKFDGNKFALPEKNHSVDTENVFFKVSQETDTIMKMLSVIAGDGYLFYWVDAIFVKGKDALDRITDYLTNEIGMEFKIIKIFKLLKHSSYICLWDENNTDKDGNLIPRPYLFDSLPKKQLDLLLDIDKNLIYKDHLNNFFK